MLMSKLPLVSWRVLFPCLHYRDGSLHIVPPINLRNDEADDYGRRHSIREKEIIVLEPACGGGARILACAKVIPNR